MLHEEAVAEADSPGIAWHCIANDVANGGICDYRFKVLFTKTLTNSKPIHW